MRAEAFGQIGIKPDEFYLMRMEDYRLLRAGFIDKNRVDETLMRYQTALMCEAFAGKGEGFKFVMSNWLIGNEVDPKTRSFERLKAKLKKHREQKALKQHLEKNG